MQDNPLKPGGDPGKAPSALDAVVLWAMVALFGAIWVAMVWAGKASGRPSGATMTDKYSPVPTFTVTEPMASVLLGAGLAIVAAGLAGGLRAFVVTSRRKREQPAERPPLRPDVCGSCGSVVAGDYTYCPRCGARL